MMKIKNPIHRSTNFEKHTTKNPVGKLFLNNFLNTVVKTIRPLNIDSVLDVGCGEGFTLARLQKEKQFNRKVELNAELRNIQSKLDGLK